MSPNVLLGERHHLLWRWLALHGAKCKRQKAQLTPAGTPRRCALGARAGRKARHVCESKSRSGKAKLTRVVGVQTFEGPNEVRLVGKQLLPKDFEGGALRLPDAAHHTRPRNQISCAAKALLSNGARLALVREDKALHITDGWMTC